MSSARGSTAFVCAKTELARVGSRGGVVADARERLEREHDLDRDAEELGDPQRELEARVVLAALEVADGLVVHTQRVGKLAPRDALLGPQRRDAVVDGVAQCTHCSAAWRAASTCDPDWRRDMRRSTMGATTR